MTEKVIGLFFILYTQFKEVDKMHELSYIIDIVNAVQEEAEKNNIMKVKKIIVDVGEMSGVVPYYLHKYYPEAVKGTNLSDTELETNLIEVQIQCEGCGNTYHPDKENRYKCPDCGERKGKLLKGKGIQINSLEIEE
ncbi:hydrogenase maturation nickel metallochaperone HypA/HybF [Butyrivibrio sp. ob235]|uniref:hydrogenase maturation nickel metallochaperone HypA/HybF n=1 Tax=Butyrivibrio sp. ob235 TaxID=1761780 RepID=UPI001FA7A737|nr:hydrogenase maturation nickel metallochaperone HypA [Butyrivibrio sp. ob235]